MRGKSLDDTGSIKYNGVTFYPTKEGTIKGVFKDQKKNEIPIAWLVHYGKNYKKLLMFWDTKEKLHLIRSIDGEEFFQSNKHPSEDPNNISNILSGPVVEILF